MLNAKLSAKPSVGNPWMFLVKVLNIEIMYKTMAITHHHIPVLFGISI